MKSTAPCHQINRKMLPSPLPLVYNWTFSCWIGRDETVNSAGSYHFHDLQVDCVLLPGILWYNGRRCHYWRRKRCRDGTFWWRHQRCWTPTGDRSARGGTADYVSGLAWVFFICTSLMIVLYYFTAFIAVVVSLNFITNAYSQFLFNPPTSPYLLQATCRHRRSLNTLIFKVFIENPLNLGFSFLFLYLLWLCFNVFCKSDLWQDINDAILLFFLQKSPLFGL